MQFIKSGIGLSWRKSVGRVAAFALMVAACGGAYATALGDAAAALQPGQWVELETNNFNDSTLNESGPILVYAEEMKWDRQRSEMEFVGAYHYQAVVHLIYSEATNGWSRRSIGGVLGMPFHGYDHSALSEETRTMYVRPFGAGGDRLQRYNLDSQSWSASASFSGPVQDAVGIEWFPEMNRVVYIDEYAIRLYDPTNNVWSLAMNDPAGLGPYHNFAEYSPKHKVVIMGGGNGSRAVYRMNSSGQITRLPDAPIELGVMSSIVTTDPIGGNFLVFGRSASYEFNPVTGTWSSLPTPPFVNLSSEFPHVQYAVAGAIPTHGVVMVAKYNGSNSKVYLYRHQAGSGVPVTQPTINLSASPLSLPALGVTTLTWSTTNADSCTSSGAWSGNRATAGTWTSPGLSASSTFTLACQNGTGGVASKSVSVTVASAPAPAPAPAPSGTGGADFASRCSAAGVVRCYGFEDSADIGDRTFGRSSDGKKLMFIDPAVKSSGNSSLRFDIPPLSPADSSGSFFLNFADDLSQRFGAGQEFYVQWRQRFSPEMLRSFQGANGWKQVIVGAGDYPGTTNYSCTEQETVMNQNTHSGPEGFPWVYHSCGTWETLEFDDGTQVRLQHQGPPYCYYPNDPDKGCMKYRPNQWMTFQMHIKVGTWNQRNSTFEAWVSYEGQPSVKIYDSALTNGFIYYRNEDPNAFFGKIWLLPYNTNKSAAENHPAAATWYDDLIISRNKIADPVAGAAAIAPNPPTNVSVE